MDVHPAMRCSNDPSVEQMAPTPEHEKNAFDPVQVGGCQYISHFGPYLYRMGSKYKKKPLVFGSSNLTWSPMAVMNFRSGISIGRLERKLVSFETEDEVFNRGFLKTLVLLVKGTEDSLKTFLDSTEGLEVRRLMKSWGVQRIQVLPIINENYLREGPYFHSLEGTFEAWRLFPDSEGAFMESALPPSLENREEFVVLPDGIYPPNRQIAIRSRLYNKFPHPTSLNNYRIAFDDMYCLQGLKDGKGLDAFREPALDSSTMVRWAVKLDGLVVGKTKVSQFNTRHKLIEDGIGSDTAFNCRAKRYRTFERTNCGGAAALAGYLWLDIAVGIDCGGNIRNAAVTHLLYAFKPSYLLHDTFDPGERCLIWNEKKADLAKSYQLFSVPSFLSRSIGTLRASLSLNPDIGKLCKRYPYFGRLLFPANYYVKDYEAVQDLVEVFVSKLARYLELRPERKSLDEIWKENGPPDVGLSFAEYFKTTFSHLQWFEHSYDEEKDQLRYSDCLHPQTKQYWNDLINLDKGKRFEALDQMFIHNKWFLEGVMESNTPLVDSIVVIPRFTDKYSSDPSERLYNRFDSNYHASLTGCPNLIVPIGQVKGPSTGLSNDGMIPVSVSLIAPRGSDVYFLNTMEKFLGRAGLRTDVMAGEFAFNSDETETLLEQKSTINADDTNGLTVNWTHY